MSGRRFPLLAGAAALAVAVVTAKGRGRDLDRRVYTAANRDRGRSADRFFRTVTELGSIWAAAGAAATIAAKGRRRQALDAFGAAGAMWGIGQLAKRVFLRPRPYHALEDVRLLIERPRGTSWPSSHPAVLLAFLTVLTRDLDAPATVRAGAAGLAGVVGASRVYLGVHYPADVVGGLLLGRGVADVWSVAVSPRLCGNA
jgi:membrane-associated phospholipid phosphatase